MASVKEVTDETFEEVVLQAGRPVLVDFWATWCAPCHVAAPMMERLASKYEDAIDVAKVDVDANPGISQALQVMTLPTFVFFRPGAQPMAIVGARPMEQLEAAFGLSQYATPESQASA